MSGPLSHPSSLAPHATLTSALWGVWRVDPRASTGALRMSRLTFYRDFRFGSRSLDGRTQVYGGWSLSPSPISERTTQSELVVARLALRFDRDVAPSAEFAVSYAHPPLGPIALHEGEHTRLVLVRAPAIHAAVAGRWQPDAPDGARVLDALELGLDGLFTLRLPGSVARTGRWSFERDAQTSTRTAVLGALVLDPQDATLPVERWPVRVDSGPRRTLSIASIGPLRSLAAVDTAARALLGVWRRAAPAKAPSPDELVFRGDGSAELLARPNTPRGQGRWTFEHVARGADALEGQLVIAVTSPATQRTVYDRRRVRLAFARCSELEFLADGERGVLRYRRLFR